MNSIFCLLEHLQQKLWLYSLHATAHTLGVLKQMMDELILLSPIVAVTVVNAVVTAVSAAVAVVVAMKSRKKVCVCGCQNKIYEMAELDEKLTSLNVTSKLTLVSFLRAFSFDFVDFVHFCIFFKFSSILQIP